MAVEELTVAPLSVYPMTQTYLVRLWFDPAGWRIMVQHIPTDKQFFFTDGERFFHFWSHQLEDWHSVVKDDG